MINPLLTIIMYHYVRPLSGSAFPEIKGLEVNDFTAQLEYIKQHYNIVHPNDVLSSLYNQSTLPERAALLTFDDGYKDHFDHVLPVLAKNKISGVFFPPSSVVKNRELLDVNRIHFVLASSADKTPLIQHVENAIEERREEFGLDSLEFYRTKFRIASRLDPADVIYLKRLLQVALPEELRNTVARELFAKYVSKDEYGFADDLYMNTANVKKMLDAGMVIGSHGHKHYWLESLDKREQAEDIDTSLNFLRDVGVSMDKFWFCYPYGSYNQQTLELLRERRCGVAVTTETNIANLASIDPLTVPRLDTIDLPKNHNSAANQWTLRAQCQI